MHSRTCLHHLFIPPLAFCGCILRVIDLDGVCVCVHIHVHVHGHTIYTLLDAECCNPPFMHQYPPLPPTTSSLSTHILASMCLSSYLFVPTTPPALACVSYIRSVSLKTSTPVSRNSGLYRIPPLADCRPPAPCSGDHSACTCVHIRCMHAHAVMVYLCASAHVCVCVCVCAYVACISGRWLGGCQLCTYFSLCFLHHRCMGTVRSPHMQWRTGAVEA